MDDSSDDDDNQHVGQEKQDQQQTRKSAFKSDDTMTTPQRVSKNDTKEPDDSDDENEANFDGREKIRDVWVWVFGVQKMIPASNGPLGRTNFDGREKSPLPKQNSRSSDFVDSNRTALNIFLGRNRNLRRPSFMFEAEIFC